MGKKFVYLKVQIGSIFMRKGGLIIVIEDIQLKVIVKNMNFVFY